jgi:hypothetical protein
MAAPISPANAAHGNWQGRYVGFCTDVCYPSVCGTCAAADIGEGRRARLR